MGINHSYPHSRTVETSHGKVRGRRLICSGEKQVDAFQGIPFAKPPLGPLRFQKPEPPERWDGVKDTKKFSKRAIQEQLLFLKYFQKGTTSEDCLYLNVFTPCWKPPNNSSGFPVMVFVHGGGFVIGDAAHYGDYRLGYLGFFTTGDDECRGNLGLWDLTAALRWVNDNIEAFGGDKNNITLVGHSAGAISSDMLHLSPHSTDLFHKMILMAGSAEFKLLPNKNLPQRCLAKAGSMGITKFTNSKELLDQMRAVPAQKFAVLLNVFSRKRKILELDTVPWVDGDFFPASFDELRRRATPKPMITGVTKDEGLLFLLGRKPSEKLLTEVIELVSNEQSAESKEWTDELRSFYVKDTSKKELMRSIANILSDGFMNTSTLEVCRKTAANQDEPVYLYTFDHFHSTVMGMFNRFLPIQDATHGAELMYLFNKGIFFSTPNLTDSDRTVMDSFTNAFVNFSKLGNPNSSDICSFSVGWIPVDKMNFGRNFVFNGSACYMSEEFMEEGHPLKLIEILQAEAGNRS